MEPSFIQSLLDWIAQHQTWAGVIIFLVAMGESLAIVGVMVPGVAVMLSMGALISIGVLPFWPSFWWAVAGAIVGDGLSFWLGYHFKDQLRNIWPFKRYPDLVKKGEEFFEKHGGKSVFLGRFFGPVRAIIPTTAGMMQMSPWRFNVVNVSSALLWAPIYLGVGMVIGASLSLATEVATRLAMLAIALGLFLWAGLWILRKLYRSLAPRAANMSEALLKWGRSHPHLGQVTAALVDPQQAELKGILILGTTLITLAWLMIWLFSQITVGPLLARLDSSTYHLMQGLRTPWGDQFMTAISQLGDGLMHIALATTVALWLLSKRLWLAAGHWIAAIGFGAIATWVLKQSLQLPRPTTMFDGAMAYSFPSAHSVLAVCSFGFLAVLIAREIAPQRRWLVYSIAWGFILLIAFSRLYLGAHWLSDVAGGLTIGLIWLIIVGVAFRRHLSPGIPVSGLIIVPVATLVGVGSWHIISTHDENLARYQPHYEVSQMSASQWSLEGWQTLPTFRIDTRGIEKQPFNFQWAGKLEELEQQLVKEGWSQPMELSFGTSLLWLNPEAKLTEQPILPQAHDGRHQSWQLILEAQNLIIRLWPADIILGVNETPLWQGYIGKLQRASLPLLTLPRVGDDFDTPIAYLLQGFPMMNKQMQLRQLEQPPSGEQWHGQVLLMWPLPTGDR